MRKNTDTQSGFFNPRIFVGFLLCSAGAWMAMLSFASTPPSGTLTDTSGPLNYSAGPFNQPNPSPLGAGQLDTGPRCNAQFPCDNFALTVNVPAAYLTANPNAFVKVTMSWNDTGSGNSDYDLYIYKGVVGNTNGSMPADYQSASGNNPEIANISPLTAGPQQYSIKIVPFTPTGEVVHVRIELFPGAAGGGGGGGPFGGPDPTVPGVPRYQNYYAPDGTSAQASSGEFNIGVNITPSGNGHIFTMNSGPIWRLTPPERLSPAKPECCEALWEDKSSTVTDVGLDPILWTDKVSGRTFASNTTTGAVGSVYTDSFTPMLNDGDHWLTPVAGPNGGADHQTIGSGPYPAALDPVLGNAVNQHQAVYYCSQDVAGPAACQRSDDLGVHWATVGTLPYDGTTGPGCGGLHGHIHVAPNGTVWLPVNQCNGKQGGATSPPSATGAATTWSQFVVQGNNDVNGGAPFVAASQSNGADPSIGLDSDSTAYYCYVNNQANGSEGHVHVAVSTDNGATWIRDVDVGVSHGIVNAALTEAVGGTSGRAACGFVGTNKTGDYQSGTFPGKWYAFIATTYDQGRTWVTVNATPNDPVQSMTGIWQQGGGNQDRNLLDFNEITVDAKGKVLYGYDDGCVSPGCVSGTAGNDYTAFMRVAHQSGGKPLYSQFDPNPPEPTVPKPPCLSGTRDATGSHLAWKIPDNGGSDITSYQIFRSTASGAEVFLASTGIVKAGYDDTTADPSVPDYFYTVKAVNAVGISNPSNEIDLTLGAPPPFENICQPPGVTKLMDPSGDNTPAAPGTDLHSFQLAQPYASDGNIKLVFTINTDNGTGAGPTNAAWYVAMKIPDPAPATTFHYRAVHMIFNGATPTFEYYTPQPNNSGVVDGRFVTAGSNHPADPSSNYNAPFNKIVIVVKASDLGLSPGSVISGFVSAVSQTAGGVVTALYDQMPDSLAYTGNYVVNDNAVCQVAVPLVNVQSVKVHGAVSQPPDGFGIDMPLTGNPGIECRTGGPSLSHKLIFKFGNPLTGVTGASVTGHNPANGTGSVTSSFIDPNDATRYIVNLGNVSNAQVITVTLTGITDTSGNNSPSLGVSMGVLLGDTTADRTVNSSDVSQTKARSGQIVGSGNFRSDVTVDGTLNSADVSSVKSKSGTALP